MITKFMIICHHSLLHFKFGNFIQFGHVNFAIKDGHWIAFRIISYRKMSSVVVSGEQQQTQSTATGDGNNFLGESTASQIIASDTPGTPTGQSLARGSAIDSRIFSTATISNEEELQAGADIYQISHRLQNTLPLFGLIILRCMYVHAIGIAFL